MSKYGFNGINTPREFLAKAQREIARLEEWYLG
jgi:hypothetical protein